METKGAPMTTSAAIAILTEEEAAAKLEAHGYVRETCAACKGAGHFMIVADDATDWKKYRCESCDGAGRIWRAPLTR